MKHLNNNNMEQANFKLYTAQDLYEMGVLPYTLKTIKHYMSVGKMPFKVLKLGGLNVVASTELDAWIQKNKSENK